MNIHLTDNGFIHQAELFQKIVKSRVPVNFENTGLELELSLDPSIGSADSYSISQIPSGWKITGADGMGIYYGIGRFLHTAKWTEEEFSPVPPANVISPACDFRAIYFAVHFYNWYQMATVEEFEDYLEQMLLWGYNTIICILPVINCVTFEDELMKHSADKLRSIFRLCRKIGMKTGIIIGANQGLKGAPHELDADLSYDHRFRGTAGRNLCLSKPAAVEYMHWLARKSLEEFTETGLDYVLTWTYDEGGCGCTGCRPWGGNKYLDGGAVICEEAKKLYPEAKIIVSTWGFDACADEGEFRGLYRRMPGDCSWIDYVMAERQRNFPKYPLEHEVIKPVVNFPEISMYALYPWGGFGANPLPKVFQQEWDSSKHILKGGMPYSEGIYEDISKIQWAGYYWDPNRNYRDILSEYISYEYSPDVCDEVLEMMELIEQNHINVFDEIEPDISLSDRAKYLAEHVDQMLSDSKRNAWRWRILYLRAVLDHKRYNWYVENRDGEKVYLTRIFQIR